MSRRYGAEALVMSRPGNAKTKKKVRNFMEAASLMLHRRRASMQTQSIKECGCATQAWSSCEVQRQLGMYVLSLSSFSGVSMSPNGSYTHPHYLAPSDVSVSTSTLLVSHPYSAYTVCPSTNKTTSSSEHPQPSQHATCKVPSQAMHGSSPAR